MEGFFEAIGWVSLVLLILVGLAAGWIASVLAGGNRGKYIVLGVIGAVAAPFVLAALGIGVLAAGGVLLLLVVALVGAAIVLALARALSGSRKDR